MTSLSLFLMSQELPSSLVLSSFVSSSGSMWFLSSTFPPKNDLLNPSFHVSHLPPSSLQFFIFKIFPEWGCSPTVNIEMQCFQNQTHAVLHSAIHPSVQLIICLSHQSGQVSQVPPLTSAARRGWGWASTCKRRGVFSEYAHFLLCPFPRCSLASLKWSILVRWCFRVQGGLAGQQRWMFKKSEHMQK